MSHPGISETSVGPHTIFIIICMLPSQDPIAVGSVPVQGLDFSAAPPGRAHFKK